MSDPRVLEKTPNSWGTIRAKFLFRNKRIVGFPEEAPLSASQKYGVVPQSFLERELDSRFMSSFKGQENFKLVEPNDFVISLRSFQGGIEHSGHRGIISPAYTVLSPSPLIQPGYYRHYLKSPRFISRLNAVITGIRDGKTIKYEEFCELLIPLPPLATQRAIAAFLDRKTAAIDALIAKKERLIALLEEKRAALINQAVTKGLDPNVPMKDSGVPWIGEIPAHWDVVQLRRVVTKFVDYRGRTPDKSSQGVPLITAGAVRDGRIDHSLAPEWVSEQVYQHLIRRGEPEIGDLLFTSEAPLGEVGLVQDTRIACAQRIILFRANRTRVTPGFLRLYLLSRSGRSEIESRGSGSTASGIRADRLRMSKVIVAPLEEQAGICDLIDTKTRNYRASHTLINEQLACLREYRQSLITAAVTGQLDIPEEEAP